MEGVDAAGSVDKKYKFLRRIPVDPMTGTKDWGLRSISDDSDSMAWCGQNVFDVYTKIHRPRGRRYAVLGVVAGE